MPRLCGDVFDGGAGEDHARDGGVSVINFSRQRKPGRQSRAAAAAGAPLSCIGSIEIPPAALDHRHIMEAEAATMVVNDGRIERVIGTTNKPGHPVVELYGWAPNVDSHADETGWMYFCPLLVGRSIVSAWEKGKPLGNRHRVLLRVGNVYRLNDFVMHWTADRRPVVALYCGVFRMPDDGLAMSLLQDGVNELSTGGRFAPRVSPGFRIRFDDECFAEVDGRKALIPISEAKQRGALIATCIKCDAYADHVDHSWPWGWEGNRCRSHIECET